MESEMGNGAEYMKFAGLLANLVSRTTGNIEGVILKPGTRRKFLNFLKIQKFCHRAILLTEMVVPLPIFGTSLDVYRDGITGGCLSDKYRQYVLDKLNISADFPKDSLNFDYSSVIP